MSCTSAVLVYDGVITSATERAKIPPHSLLKWWYASLGCLGFSRINNVVIRLFYDRISTRVGNSGVQSPTVASGIVQYCGRSFKLAVLYLTRNENSVLLIAFIH